MSNQQWGQDPYGPGPDQTDPYASSQYGGTDPYGAGQYGPGQYGQQQAQGPYQQPYQQGPGWAAQPPVGPYGYGYPMMSSKSKLAGGLLGIFLGTFGVHNFYLGHTGKAVAQLLISLLSFGFLAPVSSIWGLIEGILILASNPNSTWGRDSDGNVLQ